MKVFHVSWNAPETVSHEMLSKKNFTLYPYLKKIIRKINNLKLKNCQLKLSLQIKSEANAIKVSALNCLSVGNLMYYLNACCIIHILSYTQNIWALGFRALLKKIGESAIHRIFVTWVVFIEAIFSALNLKSDDGFLPYSMPEAFNKAGQWPHRHHIAWAESKPV